MVTIPGLLIVLERVIIPRMVIVLEIVTFHVGGKMTILGIGSIPLTGLLGPRDFDHPRNGDSIRDVDCPGDGDHS